MIIQYLELLIILLMPELFIRIILEQVILGLTILKIIVVMILININQGTEVNMDLIYMIYCMTELMQKVQMEPSTILLQK